MLQSLSLCFYAFFIAGAIFQEHPRVLQGLSLCFYAFFIAGALFQEHPRVLQGLSLCFYVFLVENCFNFPKSKCLYFQLFVVQIFIFHFKYVLWVPASLSAMRARWYAPFEVLREC